MLYIFATWLFGIIKIDIPSVLEVVLEIEKKSLLLVIVCLVPGPPGTLIEDYILLISELQTHLRSLIVGDFNLDQMLSKNVANVDPLSEIFNMPLHSQCSPQIHGGLLGLVFDN